MSTPSSNPEKAGGQNGAAAADTGNLPLLKGYVSMNDILEGTVRLGSQVHMAGLVKDCQLPMASRGSDYKMTIKLFDKSIESQCTTLSVNIFRSKEEMPVVEAGDVVLLQGVRVQSFRNERSVLTNYNTRLYVYSAAKMPPRPQPADAALTPQAWPNKGKHPTKQEHEFVSQLYHSIDKNEVPTADEFVSHTRESLNAGNKYSTLKDVIEGKFYNLVVKVVNEPYDAGNCVSMWVTDYSENPLFQDFSSASAGTTKKNQVGDELGYLNQYTAKIGNKLQSEWKGPFGKMSMQMTCFDQHAEYIKSFVGKDNWLYLMNVQVKMGRNGVCLEGFLRQDRNWPERLAVDRIDPQQDDPEHIDPRLKDAIRRHRDYEKKNKAAPAKRKSGDVDAGEEKLGKSKKRRKAQRAKEQTVRQQEQERLQKKKLQQQLERQRKQGRLSGSAHNPGQSGESSDEAERQMDVDKPPASQMVRNLNQAVVTEQESEETVPLSTVLEPVYAEVKTDSGETARIQLPFVNAKFRAQVKVVDFLPDRLEDFAVGRRRTDFDCLSDYEDGDEDEDEEAAAASSTPLDGENAIWEWRFALLLEDATPQPKTATQISRARVWVVVDNAEAQMLAGLNACDLRRETETQDELREKMFILWGNLEEVKREALRAAREAQVAARKSARLAAEAKRQRERQEQQRQKQLLQQQASRWQPPPSSDDEAQGRPGESETAVAPVSGAAVPAKAQKAAPPAVRNRPFVCCLQQYGVQVLAGEDADADRGESVWQRVFGLFGTRISNV